MKHIIGVTKEQQEKAKNGNFLITKTSRKLQIGDLLFLEDAEDSQFEFKIAEVYREPGMKQDYVLLILEAI